MSVRLLRDCDNAAGVDHSGESAQYQCCTAERGGHALSPPPVTARPVTHILQRNLIDTGLVSVALMADFLGVAIDVGQLRHQLGVGTKPATADDLVRAARLAN